MSALRERDIIHESPLGGFWVGRTRRPDSYTVYRIGVCASEPDSSYAFTEGGLSLAVKRCEYLAQRRAGVRL